MNAAKYEVGDAVYVKRYAGDVVDHAVITNRWFSRAICDYMYDFKTDDNGIGSVPASQLLPDNDKTSL